MLKLMIWLNTVIKKNSFNQNQIMVLVHINCRLSISTEFILISYWLSSHSHVKHYLIALIKQWLITTTTMMKGSIDSCQIWKFLEISCMKPIVSGQSGFFWNICRANEVTFDRNVIVSQLLSIATITTKNPFDISSINT